MTQFFSLHPVISFRSSFVFLPFTPVLSSFFHRILLPLIFASVFPSPSSSHLSHCSIVPLMSSCFSPSFVFTLIFFLLPSSSSSLCLLSSYISYSFLPPSNLPTSSSSFSYLSPPLISNSLFLPSSLSS